MFLGAEGGTGAGASSLIAQEIVDQFKNQSLISASVLFPEAESRCTKVGIYNTLLFLNSDQFKGDGKNALVQVFHNSRLEKSARLFHKVERPDMKDLNKMIAFALSDLTAASRFGGSLTTSLKKTVHNLIPFPTAKYITCSTIGLYPDFQNRVLAQPIQGLEGCFAEPSDEEVMVKALFNNHNLMTDVDLRDDRIFSFSCFFRGPSTSVSSYMVEEQLLKLKKINNSHFEDFISNNAHGSYCEKERPGFRAAGTALINSKAIAEVFNKYVKDFDLMFDKKAFLKPFLDDGMDENEFKEARSNLMDIIAEYKGTSSGNAGPKQDGKEDEEEE